MKTKYNTLSMNVSQKKAILFMMNLFCVYILLCVNDVESTTLKWNKNHVKLLLKPNEPVDLIKKRHDTVGELGSQFKKEIATETQENIDAGAVTRKVWSRWSKWGECSSTCGRGTKTRRRVCLAGRCAPGEREEQRLSCCRRPCHLNDD